MKKVQSHYCCLSEKAFKILNSSSYALLRATAFTVCVCDSKGLILFSANINTRCNLYGGLLHVTAKSVFAVLRRRGLLNLLVKCSPA